MRPLVEQCQKLNINDLVREIKTEFIQVQLKSRIEALNQVIQITTTACHFGGKRFWFICPTCKKRVGTLYKPSLRDTLLCRKCHHLTYLKSRYHRML